MNRPPIRRQKDYRIRKKALKALQDLTFLAENLDNDQQQRVFNSETLGEFWKKLFAFSDDLNEQDKEKKRQRLTAIAHNFIVHIANPPTINNLASEEQRLLLYSQIDSIPRSIQAILLASMFRPSSES